MPVSGKKILLSAYASEPGKGSEPAVGWNWAAAMSRLHEVWVITRANNQAAIEASDEPWVNQVHWVYYDLPGWLRRWKKGSRGVQLYYWLWQIGAFFTARRLHRQVRLELVHHVTFWQPLALRTWDCWACLLFLARSGAARTHPAVAPQPVPPPASLRTAARLAPGDSPGLIPAFAAACGTRCCYLRPRKARSGSRAGSVPRAWVFPQFGMVPAEREVRLLET